MAFEADMEAMQLRLLERFLAIAYDLAIQEIPSRRLREGLSQFFGTDRASGGLTIPHYWAIFVHDGAAGIRPRFVSKLIWFANPADDPRRLDDGSSPIREFSVRRLSGDEYREGLRRNAENRALGLGEYMIVRDFSAGFSARPFFDNITPQVAIEAENAAEAIVSASLGEILDRSSQTIPVTIRLG